MGEKDLGRKIGHINIKRREPRRIHVIVPSRTTPAIPAPNWPVKKPAQVPQKATR